MERKDKNSLNMLFFLVLIQLVFRCPKSWDDEESDMT